MGALTTLSKLLLRAWMWSCGAANLQGMHIRSFVATKACMCRKATITLHRSEWEQLVMERIADFTDRVLVAEDFALACRQE